jgi:hypothetical protein
MGTRISISETFSAPTGKLLLNDAILPAAGALMLIDVGHSMGGLGVAGVPADLAVIPNIAWDQAAAMVGSGNATTLGAIFDRADGTNFNLERTGKGGIHGYLSGNVAANVGLVINMPTLMQTYLFNNLTADFYISAWDRVTRVGTVATAPPIFEGIQRTASSTVSFLGAFDITNSAVPVAGNAKRLGARVTAANNVGNTYRSVGADGWSGTPPASAAEIRQQLALWGAMNAYSIFFGGTTAPPSYILYRLYIENLTVSGRTWAEVDAIDYALWQRDFGAGGRFAGDTFTASPI